MHLPDDFISNQVSGAFSGFSIAFVALSFKKVLDCIVEKVPVKKLATYPNLNSKLSSPFSLKFKKEGLVSKIFLVTILVTMFQTLDFGIFSGEKEHILGTAIALVLCGPFAGLIAISLSLLLQMALFREFSGLMLGANIFNMAFLSIGFAFFANNFFTLITKNTYARYFSIAFSSYLLTFSAVWLESSLLGTQGVIFFLPNVLLMGLVEGIITICILKICSALRLTVSFEE